MTARTPVAVSKPATAVAPRRTLRHLLLDIRKDFHIALETQNKFLAARLKLGLDLIEARARVEAGEAGDISWWQWFTKNFPQSRSAAEKAIALAESDDPEAAYEAAKAKNAEANKAYRARRRLSVSRDTEPAAPSGARWNPNPAAPSIATAPPAPAVEILPPEPDQQAIDDLRPASRKKKPRRIIAAKPAPLLAPIENPKPQADESGFVPGTLMRPGDFEVKC